MLQNTEKIVSRVSFKTRLSRVDFLILQLNEKDCRESLEATNLKFTGRRYPGFSEIWYFPCFWCELSNFKTFMRHLNVSKEWAL